MVEHNETKSKIMMFMKEEKEIVKSGNLNKCLYLSIGMNVK